MIDNQYFSFCKEIGIMNENVSHQHALDCIIKAVRGTKGVDPMFADKVSRLTLNSPEVSIRSCVLYRYDIDVDYVVNGQIKNGNISDFGSSGVHDSLKITEYKGDGSYRVLRSAAEIPYDIFNDNNLFTFEGMKKALTGVVEKRLPSSCTSFQSKNWDVCAYIVPVLVIILYYDNKEYQMYYNLQNCNYHWAWAEDPVLLNKGAQAKTYSTLITFASFFFSVIGMLYAISSSFVLALIPIALFAGQVIISKKSKKSKREYQNMFTKQDGMTMVKALTPYLAMAAMAFFTFLYGVAIG